MAVRIRKDNAHGEDQDDVESWHDEDCKLVVTQPEGWMCRVSLRTKVGLPPGELYDLLTQPDNSKVFRSIKALKSRRVLTDDRKGRQVVEVEQEAVWKFLCFGGTFTTKLIVDQNKRSGQIGFRLSESGMMKKFEGTWHIQPVASASENPELQSSGTPSWLDGPVQTLRKTHQRFSAGGGSTEASLLTLEQSVLPNVVPPKPLDRLLKGIAARQVRGLVEDVRTEVERRRREKRRSEQPRTCSAPAASLLFMSLHRSTGGHCPRRSLPPVVRRGLQRA